MEEKYITEFKNKQGKRFSWHIWATSHIEAEIIAKFRDIGEVVLGRIPHDCTDCEWVGELRGKTI